MFHCIMLLSEWEQQDTDCPCFVALKFRRNHSDSLPQTQLRMSRAFLSSLWLCHPISSEVPTSIPKVHNPFTSSLLLLRKNTLKPECVSKALHQQSFKQPLCVCVGVQQQAWRASVLLFAGFGGVLGVSPFFLVLTVWQRISIQVWKWKQGWGSYWHWFLLCVYMHRVSSSFPHFTHSCSAPSHKMSLT